MIHIYIYLFFVASSAYGTTTIDPFPSSVDWNPLSKLINDDKYVPIYFYYFIIYFNFFFFVSFRNKITPKLIDMFKVNTTLTEENIYDVMVVYGLIQSKDLYLRFVLACDVIACNNYIDTIKNLFQFIFFILYKSLFLFLLDINGVSKAISVSLMIKFN